MASFTYVFFIVQAYWKIFCGVVALLFVRFYYKVHACLSAAESDFKITCLPVWRLLLACFFIVQAYWKNSIFCSVVCFAVRDQILL